MNRHSIIEELEERIRHDAEKISRLSKEISEKDYLLNSYNENIFKRALEGILRNPHGCPMCDCGGKLRNPEKEHWDNCPYLFANNVLNNQL